MSAIHGTFGLTGRIFDRWRNFKDFSTDFDGMAHILSLRSGLKIEIDPDRLRIVHEKWLSAEAAWLDLLLPSSTEKLSHLKMTAILLEKLCELTPLEVVDPNGSCTNDTEESKDIATSYQDADWGHSGELPVVMEPEDVKKLLDGQSHYVGWLLAYYICRHFESERRDRIDAFVERITDEFEIDMVSALISGRMSAQSIHIALKALFLRD